MEEREGKGERKERKVSLVPNLSLLQCSFFILEGWVERKKGRREIEMEKLQTLPKYPDDRMKFKGEYIAYVEDRIVAHSKRLREVLLEAKRYSDKPIIDKVEKEELLIV